MSSRSDTGRNLHIGPDDVVSLIVASVQELNDHRRSVLGPPLTPSTVLFGREGLFDSLGLVTLIVDIEQKIADLGISITIVDERAFAERDSAFRTVQSLANYIGKLLVELESPVA